MEILEDASNESTPRSQKNVGEAEKRSLCDGRKAGKRRRKRAFADSELPCPPPDPTFSGSSARVSFPDSDWNATGARAPVVEDAFDHLDKFHSMIEEILEIRDRNAKLFRRVRELERARATRKARIEVERCVSVGQDLSFPDEDVGFAESLLGAMLASSCEFTPRSSTVGNSSSTKSRPAAATINESRRVSCPVTADAQLRILPGYSSYRIPDQVTKKRPSLGVGTPKVSKWTRVKAAFKWERAACTANDGITEPEAIVRYLRIPENPGAGSSEVSGPPTPATVSSSSSIDDVFHRPHRPSSHRSTRITRSRDESSDPSRRSRSLDGDASMPMNFVYSARTRFKDNAVLDGKSGSPADPRSHKTPWGKVKDMMQLRRDSLSKQTTRSGSRNDDAHSISSIESSDIHRSEFQQMDGRPPRIRITADSTPCLAVSLSKSGPIGVSNDSMDLASRRLTPTLTITVPSSEELRSLSSPESVTPPPPKLSAEIGKSDRYSQAGYDTPKETRTGRVSPASSSSGVPRYGLGRSKTCQGATPSFPGDFKRQQSWKGESLGSSPKMQRRNSKWNKVKRAFLTSATSVPTSPSRISSYFFDDGDATGGSYSASASAEDLDNDGASNPGAEAEIQRNYRLLHDKLGTEFYRKLAEWEKLKASNARDLPKCSARDRDAENLRLLGEERLTPEFKKKLEEWKRMNKGETRASNPSDGRSVNRRRITDWQLWRSPLKPDTNKPDSPRLSEDFVKKMEQWKRIKSAAARRETEVEEESHPRESPVEGLRTVDINEPERTFEGNSTSDELSEERHRTWKSLEDEEFTSLEKVLEAMEMDRQTRLSKLQRIVGSPPQRTQEVLIHTSTGLYRFEGISRKFTRKLYEWEKSQGISPELSTFRLLDPLRYGVGSLRSRGAPETGVDSASDRAPRRILYRSKSVGSVQTNSWRTTREHEKRTIRRPSSLSLNDLDNHEARSCIIASSVPTIPDEEDTSEDIAMEDSEAEPEAVIVDIEDVIEETASPLRKYQPHQTPVYSVAGSETTSIAVPLGTVTARHEPSPVILIEPGEAHPSRARTYSANEIIDDASRHAVDSSSFVSFSSSEPRQQRPFIAAGGRRTKREIHYEDDDKLPSAGNSAESGNTTETTEAKNDEVEDSSAFTCPDEGEGNSDPLDSNEKWRMVRLTRDRGPENLERMRMPNEAVVTVHGNARHSRKILKTRRLTDTQVGYEWRPTDRSAVDDYEVETERTDPSRNVVFEDNPDVERIIITEETINRIVVPTASGSASISAALDLDRENREHETISRKEKREPKSVFVETKRIVFSPFRREAKRSTDEGIASKSEISKLDRTESNRPLAVEEPSTSSFDATITADDTFPRRCSEPKRSPVSSRKEHRVQSPKETSSNIRTMIRRYNEKLENETSASTGAIIIGSGSVDCSGTGSGSPGWRSSANERRPFTRMERYDEAKKPVGSRNICRHSRTASPEHSTGLASSDDLETIDTGNDGASSLSIRASKIRQARDNFFSIDPSRDDTRPDRRVCPLSETLESDEIEETNEDRSGERVDLVKSASAGMINVDADTFERFQLAAAAAAAASRVSDSLPRSNEHLRHPAASEKITSRFSQIARKFKRARLRRAKEKESSNLRTVSVLCGQSLLVDIVGASSARESGTGNGDAGSDSPSPGSHRKREDRSDADPGT